MRRVITLASFLAVVGVLSPAVTHAQDFGVMESAETINQGNFKLRVNPLLFFGRNGADDTTGVAAMFGYGFTPRFDIEGGVALGDGVRIFGATAEFNVARNEDASFSVIPGFHVRRGDLSIHTTALDLVFLGSTRGTPRLDFYGGLDLSFERSDFFDFETVHLVPGLEYKLSDDLDVLVEFGLGLNDDSFHYVSGGLAFYLR